MNLPSMLALAFAVSLDSFTVGTTYGLRKINIPFSSMMIIACCTALTLLLAMGFGEVMETFISPEASKKLGGLILILIGGWILFQFFRSRKEKKKIKKNETLVHFEIKKLGIVIEILRKPMAADMDESGTISGFEAFLLGVALSLDSFGAGIGAAMLDSPPLLTALIVALMSATFLSAGKQCGHLFSKKTWLRKASVIPGFLLILLGIWKI
jgi:putative sporulation protein YtaF